MYVQSIKGMKKVLKTIQSYDLTGRLHGSATCNSQRSCLEHCAAHYAEQWKQQQQQQQRARRVKDIVLQ
jgi:hypothetical protein